MELGTLNLDDALSWHDDFRTLVYAADSWARIVHAIGSDEGSTTEFILQLDCDPRHLRDDVATQLRREALRVLESRYQYVSACHGCRVHSRQSYLQYGIRPSDPDAMVTQARALLGDLPGFDHAVSDLRRGTYFAHNRGKVGMLLS